MPTLENAPVVEASPAVEVKTAKKAAPKKATAKKETKKAAPKKGAKKAAPTKAKGESQGRAKKDGLRSPQVRILAALAKHGEMTRSAISEKGSVDVAACVEYLGSDDNAKRLANDKKHFPSLVSLGYVKQDWHPNKETEAQGPTHYTITAAGKKALEAASK